MNVKIKWKNWFITKYCLAVKLLVLIDITTLFCMLWDCCLHVARTFNNKKIYFWFSSYIVLRNYWRYLPSFIRWTQVIKASFIAFCLYVHLRQKLLMLLINCRRCENNIFILFTFRRFYDVSQYIKYKW